MIGRPNPGKQRLMLDWLKQRVIQWLLSRTVGKYITIRRQDLHAEASADEWTLVARNLAVKDDCLDDAEIPFRVRSGAVQKLTVIWCKEKVIKLHIHSTHLVLESRADSLQTPEAKARAENAAKQRLLQQWEQNLDDNFTAKPAQSPGTGDKKEPPAYRAFLDKLEVSIDTIDFVYQDPDGTFGGHIDSITLENNVASPADHQDHTVKSATLSGLAIYIDAAGAEHPNCTSSLPASGPPLKSSTRPTGSYVLHPCKVAMRVGYDTPGASFDLARPRISMEATIPVVSLEMKRWQLLCAVKVMDLFDGRRRLLLERPGRPRSSPLQDPRAWWRYVCAFLREEVADRRRRCSAAYMLERRQSRLEYCELYLQQRDDALSLQGAARLEAIEAAHGFNDIVYFRCTAIRQLQQQSALDGLVPRRKSLKAPGRGKTWRAAFFGPRAMKACKRCGRSSATSSWRAWVCGSCGGVEWAEDSGAESGPRASAPPASSSGDSDWSRDADSSRHYSCDGDRRDGAVQVQMQGGDGGRLPGLDARERQEILAALGAGGEHGAGAATYSGLVRDLAVQQQVMATRMTVGLVSARLIDAGHVDVEATFGSGVMALHTSPACTSASAELGSL